MLLRLLQVAALEWFDEAVEVRLAAREGRAAYTVEAMNPILELQLQFGQLRLGNFRFA